MDLDPQIKAKFREAAQYIREHGHCKKNYEDDTGRVCAFGALAKVHGITIRPGTHGGSLNSPEDYWKIESHLNNAGLTITWNDAPERTAEEVIAKLEELGAE